VVRYGEEQICRRKIKHHQSSVWDQAPAYSLKRAIDPRCRGRANFGLMDGRYLDYSRRFSDPERASAMPSRLFREPLIAEPRRCIAGDRSAMAEAGSIE
jgi:hypothetical protein